ncbi:MAG: S-adenosyl-L-homocysteine hydrolase [Solirubrobacteraceae bacterium]|nr:S-adenosyl-L-homocysteine hydrolase [Solirubrobacteraceae bacterium]
MQWADGQMPVLRSIRERFSSERPLAGLKVGACLHVTAETANLARTLAAGGAEVAVCAANPLSTQDDVAAVLEAEMLVRAKHGSDPGPGQREVADWGPTVTLDDGADLLALLHESGGFGEGFLGATEETTTGLVRARALGVACPVLALNEARTERVFNDHYGTGQSTLDGILRATNILLAGRTVVVLGYGTTGHGIAARARGAGAQVIVCEVDPLRALEARMEGFNVMPAIDAAAVGDVFITVTGVPGVLGAAHFARMKDGATLANAGHFDVEIDLPALDAAASDRREVLPLVEQFEIGDRRLNLLAAGRVVNLAAGQGHPAEIMDISFALHALAVEWLAREGAGLAPGIHPVPADLDREIARLKLASLGVGIDALTAEQRAYRDTFS